MGKRMKSGEVVNEVNGKNVRGCGASPLQPVSADLTEYGLELLGRNSKMATAASGVPNEQLEKQLMADLHQLVGSVDELRMIAILWVQATMPGHSYSSKDVSSISDLLYMIYNGPHAFSKNGIVKGLLERGLLEHPKPEPPFMRRREEPVTFVQRAVRLSDRVIQHIDQIDQVRVEQQEAAVRREGLLSFRVVESEEVVSEPTLAYLKRTDSSITLKDHFLSQELASRIHNAAHARNRGVYEIMHKLGVYTGPLKQEEGTTTGRNVILLWGPPGTGKTSAAYAIAGELNVPLLSMNVDSVLGMYQGESEENVRAIFEEYRRYVRVTGVQAVLLMDECDSLMMRRNRRRLENGGQTMANIVNIILDEIVRFEGTVIMTTNLLDTIDEAFARRIDETIEIGYPSRDIQRKMWRHYLPSAVRGVDAINIEQLLDAGNLTGALIVKCIERAVKGQILQHGENITLTTDDLMDEIRREMSSFDTSLKTENTVRPSFGFV